MKSGALVSPPNLYPPWCIPFAFPVVVNACSDHDALRSAGINSAVSFKSWLLEFSVLRELFRLLRRSIFYCHQLPMADQVSSSSARSSVSTSCFTTCTSPGKRSIQPNPPEANVGPEQAPPPDALGEEILYLSSLLRFSLWHFLCSVRFSRPRFVFAFTCFV